jgi:penicillin-binding protein-related factor A (putative recombinase)
LAQNNGKRFESNIQASCNKQEILYERYKDNGKFGFDGNNATRFSSENPCDAHIFHKGNLIYLELKTALTGSISFNQPPLEQIKGKAKPSIKTHQVKSLLERSRYDGVTCGLLVSFSDRQTKTSLIEGGTYFIEINKWYEWACGSQKKSMNLGDAKSIGLPVKSEKLKVNYRYDIEDLIERIIDGEE